MSDDSSPYRCLACSAPIHFLQERCANCGEEHDWQYFGECEACGAEIDYLAGGCVCGVAYSPWRVIEQELLYHEAPITVSKDAVARPMEAGYRRHLGAVKGQWADYRRVLEDGDEFHVRVFRDHYEIHLDEVSAIDDPTLHAVRYGPRSLVITTRGVIDGLQQTIDRSNDLLSRTLAAPFRLLADSEEP